MSKSQWQELRRTRALTMTEHRSIDLVTFTMPTGETKDIYLRNESSAAAVFALTPDQRVVVAKQYRLGPAGVLFEMLGYIEPGEDPLVAGVRELREETGYVPGRAFLVGSCWDDASSNAKRYCIVATDCRLATGQSLDETEFVNVELMEIPDFLRVVRSGLLTDAEVAYRALDHMDLL